MAGQAAMEVRIPSTMFVRILMYPIDGRRYIYMICYANRRMMQLTTTMYREGINYAIWFGLLFGPCRLNSGRLASDGVRGGWGG